MEDLEAFSATSGEKNGASIEHDDEVETKVQELMELLKERKAI